MAPILVLSWYLLKISGMDEPLLGKMYSSTSIAASQSTFARFANDIAALYARNCTGFSDI